MLPDPQSIVSHLRKLQWQIVQAIVSSRGSQDLHTVDHASSADTIYRLDMVIEPVIERFCSQWGRSLPMVVVAEGLEPETGRTFPDGLREEEAVVRLILDPIDGTRGIMYDKRAAWSLAGVAPNRGAATRLRDIEVAVMTELPTSKMACADVLWAVRGQGAHGVRTSLATQQEQPLRLCPSAAGNIDHGFAAISSFFPGAKVLAAELMEYLVRELIGPAAVDQALVFDDQYISTGGQFYELIVGHDRFIADLRPLFYRIQRQPPGLCAHPYDCATMLIAREAGVVLTDGWGQPLDGPFDVTTGLPWAGYANRQLADKIQPLIGRFLRERGI